jgi:hypothetical protein
VVYKSLINWVSLELLFLFFLLTNGQCTPRATQTSFSFLVSIGGGPCQSGTLSARAGRLPFSDFVLCRFTSVILPLFSRHLSCNSYLLCRELRRELWRSRLVVLSLILRALSCVLLRYIFYSLCSDMPLLRSEITHVFHKLRRSPSFDELLFLVILFVGFFALCA